MWWNWRRGIQSGIWLSHRQDICRSWGRGMLRVSSQSLKERFRRSNSVKVWNVISVDSLTGCLVLWSQTCSRWKCYRTAVFKYHPFSRKLPHVQVHSSLCSSLALSACLLGVLSLYCYPFSVQIISAPRTSAGFPVLFSFPTRHPLI